MNYLHWIFLAIYGLLIVGTMVTILMDNRQPAKAMAWILVLTFMPVVGIILYIFFGQNTRKERMISQQSLDQLTKRSMLEFAEQRDLTIPQENRMLVQQFINESMALPFKGNSIDIYTTGHDFFVSLLQAIGQAMPIVTIGPRVEGVNCVNITSDLSLSVRKSITHLYALGHRRISFIGGSGGVRSSSARRRAYYREMERLGLAADQESVNDAGFTPQTGEACVNRILNALPRENWPTAMIAINDLVALGAMRQLQRMNIRVPEDMALIGCDNQFFTPFLTPPLTTVDLHPFDHGALAIRELVNAVKGNASAFSQVRECSLIVRESCGALLGIRPELA